MIVDDEPTPVDDLASLVVRAKACEVLGPRAESARLVGRIVPSRRVWSAGSCRVGWFG